MRFCPLVTGKADPTTAGSSFLLITLKVKHEKDLNSLPSTQSSSTCCFQIEVVSVLNNQILQGADLQLTKVRAQVSVLSDAL